VMIEARRQVVGHENEHDLDSILVCHT